MGECWGSQEKGVNRESLQEGGQGGRGPGPQEPHGCVEIEITSFCLFVSPLLGKVLYLGLCLILGILRGEPPSCPQGTSSLGQCCLTPTAAFLE